MARKPVARRAKAGRKTRARAARRRAKVATPGRSAKTSRSKSAKRRAVPKGTVRASGRAKGRVKARATLRRRKPAGLLSTRKRVARKTVGGAPRPPSGVRGVRIKGEMKPRYDEILTPPALAFLADLHRNFEARRQILMRARAERQKRFDAGELPDFLPETKWVRDSAWRIASIPAALICSGVAKSGSPALKLMMSRPCSRRFSAFAVMLTVAEGRIRCRRSASRMLKLRYLKMRTCVRALS